MKRALLILILAGEAAAAQSWSVQNSGTTSDLFSVCFTSSLNGWVAGQNGTVLHTTNGGVSWAESHFTTLWLSGISFKDSLVGLAVGVDGSMFRTTDAGASWVPESSGTTVSLYSVAFGSDSAAYAAGDNGVVLRSTDDGASWQIAAQNTANWRAYAHTGTTACGLSVLKASSCCQPMPASAGSIHLTTSTTSCTM